MKENSSNKKDPQKTTGSSAQQPTQKDESSDYTQVLEQSELDDIFRSIQQKIRQQRRQQSGLKGDIYKSSAPRRRSRTLPLIVIIPSIILGFISAILLLDRFTDNRIFSRLFPNLENVSETPSNVNQNQVIRKIQDDAQQQIVDLQIALLNQQRTLEYVEVEQETAGNDANAAELQRSAADLQREQEALQEALQRQGQLESELSQIESQAARSFSDYSALVVEQERLDLLLNQYLSLTNDIRNAIEANNPSVVEREVGRLRTFLNAFSTGEGGVLRPLILSGENFIAAAEEYIVALNSSARVEESADPTETGDANLVARVQELERTIEGLGSELDNIRLRKDICEDDLVLCKRDQAN